jgi:hypothetical protein
MRCRVLTTALPPSIPPRNTSSQIKKLLPVVFRSDKNGLPEWQHQFVYIVKVKVKANHRRPGDLF